MVVWFAFEPRSLTQINSFTTLHVCGSRAYSLPLDILEYNSRHLFMSLDAKAFVKSQGFASVEAFT